MSGKVLDFHDANFRSEVLESELPTLVDFWAAWCGPCRAMAPAVEALAGELAGRVRVGKLNVDENPRTARTYGIRGIPAFLLFRGGEVVRQFVGMRAKEDLRKEVEGALEGKAPWHDAQAIPA